MVRPIRAHSAEENPRELAFGAGVAVEDESFVFWLFVTAITHYNQLDL